MIHCSIKIVLIGESSVGKSSIAHRFINNKFSDDIECTIGASYFHHREIDNDRGVTSSCSIWDTAGQERYRSMLPLYYKNANVALIVHSDDIQGSYDYAIEWLHILNDKCSDSLKCVLVIRNKVDNNLIGDYEDNEIDSDFIKEIQEKLKFNVTFIVASAKNNININRLFKQSILIATKEPEDVPDNKSNSIIPEEGRTTESSWGISCCFYQ